MKEWLEWHLGYLDWEKIRKRILVLAVVILSIPFSIKAYSFLQGLYFNKEISGRIIKVAPIEIMSQTRQGNRQSILGYKVTYTYTVRGIKFESTSSMTGWITKPRRGYAIVRYRENDPGSHILLLE